MNFSEILRGLFYKQLIVRLLQFVNLPNIIAKSLPVFDVFLNHAIQQVNDA